MQLNALNKMSLFEKRYNGFLNNINFACKNIDFKYYN